MNPSVLIVDDEEAARYGIRRALEKQGYSIAEADSVRSAEESLERSRADVVLLDLRLALDSGLDYLPVLVARNDPPVVIVVTAHGSERLAVETIKRGAYDYLAKPFEVDELRLMVRNAVELSRLRNENERLRGELAETASFGQLIGSSPAMRTVYSLIEKVAETDASVLITGESGTGKEVVAREIHNRSGKRGPFVALNCAAIPDELIESELFGHEKGAFTGAAIRRIGKFESAAGGTLFLDEVADMSLSTQAKLLRVLEEKTFQRLGSNEMLTTDARIVSATNRDLDEAVVSQKFRQDLFYRLCVLKIDLPSLRERKSDIPSLAQAFCARYSSAYRRKPLSLSQSVHQRLLEYEWPGNIRQLRNCIERAVVLAEGEKIELNVLPKEIDPKFDHSKKLDAVDSITVDGTTDLKEAKREFERKFIEKCLERNGGNITQAAAVLGMHRQSLQHKIKELGLIKKFVG